MNLWERIHGKTLSISEIGADGKIKITTDKSALSILFSKVKHWYSQLDLSMWPIYILNTLNFIGWGIISIALGLLLTVQILKSIDYLFGKSI